MELFILLIIAFVVGYFLAGSRYSKNIDETTEKVATTSKGWIDKGRDWWRGRFGKQKPPAEEVIDATEQPSTEGEMKPAEKSVSRRKSDVETET